MEEDDVFNYQVKLNQHLWNEFKDYILDEHYWESNGGTEIRQCEDKLIYEVWTKVGEIKVKDLNDGYSYDFLQDKFRHIRQALVSEVW